MSLNRAKLEVLKVLWKTGKPAKSRELAPQLGLRVPPTTLHLLWLKKKGYVFTPEKGFYAITEKGKEVLVLPKIDPNQALRILSSVPREKAFHFYRDINQYLGTFATSLSEFYKQIQVIDDKSIEFHLPRRDFELWFLSLGDFELAKRMSVIRKSELLREDLRKKVYEVVKARCEELESLARELGFV